ncbi:hypothetical protein O1611_g2882 [Lasiodiplodia mahajangana]|uniref:Uncharacterized protein n=1 Tax=Lasiodiplodia mahajangana TaxID=1108764 RepID=A0ACC2JTD7_9PEZI|nr:hypothetical protein O1611_g2882 [Lasiodiplodia mahajangana]
MVLTTPDSSNLDQFWTVFSADIPRVPSVDELIVRIVAINYPQGIVTDIHGAQISPPLDPATVTQQILLTIQTALDLETQFWTKQLRQNHLYTPYAWALRLSSNVAIKEAETQVTGALAWVGHIKGLDTLFWEAFHRTWDLYKKEGRII